MSKLIKLFKKNNEEKIQEQYELLISKEPEFKLKNLSLIDKKNLLYKVIETDNPEYLNFLQNNNFNFSFKNHPDLFDNLVTRGFYTENWEQINSILIKDNNIKSLTKKIPNLTQALLHYAEFKKVQWLIDKGFPTKEINAENAISAAVRNLNAKEIEDIINLNIVNSKSFGVAIKQAFSDNLLYISENRKTYLQKSKFALRFSDCLDVLEKYNLMDKNLKNEVCMALSCISDTPFEFLNELFMKYKPNLSKIDMSVNLMIHKPEEYLLLEKGKVYNLLKKHYFDFEKINLDDLIKNTIKNGEKKLLETFLIDFGNEKMKADMMIETAFRHNNVSIGLSLVKRKLQKTLSGEVHVKNFLDYVDTLNDKNFENEVDINKTLKTVDTYFHNFLDNKINGVHTQNIRSIKNLNFFSLAFIHNKEMFSNYLDEKTSLGKKREELIFDMSSSLYSYIKNRGGSFIEELTKTENITLDDKIILSKKLMILSSDDAVKFEIMHQSCKALKEKIELEKILKIEIIKPTTTANKKRL